MPMIAFGVTDWVKYHLDGFADAIYRRVGQFMEIGLTESQEINFTFPLDKTVHQYLPTGFMASSDHGDSFISNVELIYRSNGTPWYVRRTLIQGIPIVGWDQISISLNEGVLKQTNVILSLLPAIIKIDGGCPCCITSFLARAFMIEAFDVDVVIGKAKEMLPSAPTVSEVNKCIDDFRFDLEHEGI